MTRQRERMEEALRKCAEAGVPETVDLWPGIEERVGKRASVGRRRSRYSRIVPKTRLGWIFAVLLVLLFGTGAYAASTMTESKVTIEEATLRRGNGEDEIVVRARVQGKANLPRCFLIEGSDMAAIKEAGKGGELPDGRIDSLWPDEKLTESRQVNDTTVFVFRGVRDPDGKIADPRRESFFATCSAGTGPGGSGPGIRVDEAHVEGTPVRASIMPENQEFVKKDMASREIEPPVATLSAAGRSVEGEVGTYCWTPGSRSEERNVLWCWDSASEEDQVPEERYTLTVPSGSAMVFDLDERTVPDSVVAGGYPLFYGKMTSQPTKGLRAIRRGDRFEIPADIPTGDYVVAVFVSGPQGEADYSFRIAVR